MFIQVYLQNPLPRKTNAATLMKSMLDLTLIPLGPQNCKARN